MFQDIIQQMRHNGINPPDDLIPDEKIHRFQADPTDKKNSAWYRGYRNVTRKGDDFFVFVYGNWQEDVVYTSSSGIKIDKQDKQRMQDQIRKAQKAAEEEKKELQKKAAQEAKEKWSKLSESSDEIIKNSYLEKKGLLKTFGGRLDFLDLIIPMRDIDGEIKNLEKIPPDGINKKGLFGGQRDGLFHQIGEMKDVVYICEGFSTAASVHMAMNECAICCFNAGNLPKVAQKIAEKYPAIKIIICADDDRYPNKKGEIVNNGRIKAEEAAQISGGKCVLPSFKSLETFPTDFNDLYQLEGPETVFNQIQAINPALPVETYDVSYVIHAPYPDENEKTFSKKRTKANVIELMRRLRIIARYNVISKDIEILIPNFSYTRDNKAMACLMYIYDWCERVGIPTSHVKSYLVGIADQNLYNPVATWVTSKPWDGVSRLADLFATIEAKGEISDGNLLCMKEKLIKTWMISAIAAAFEPHGVSAHGVLVLQGPQYLGKTAWFKSLAPRNLDLIADGMFLKSDDKDSIRIILSNWIVELGELDATFRKSDIAQLKAFITRSRDRLRRAYAPEDSDLDRRTVFCGSVNEKDFLRDPTGNRRFWTIECEKINYNHGLDMQQIWAEVLTLYRAGTPWVLSNEEIMSLNEHNEKFTPIDPIFERISTYFPWENKDAHFALMNATQVCLEIGIMNPKRSDQASAGMALKQLGVEADRHRKYRIPQRLIR